MNISEIGSFISAGNALFELNGNVYKITKHKNFEIGNRTWHVLINVQRDGCSAFGYLGRIKNREFSHSMYSIFGPETDCFNVFDHFFLQVVRGKALPASMAFRHMGRCGRCGRKLKDPDSVDRGLGPECAKKYN